MICQKYIARCYRVYQQERKCIIFVTFQRRQEAKMAIFKLSSILKKPEHFRIF